MALITDPNQLKQPKEVQMWKKLGKFTPPSETQEVNYLPNGAEFRLKGDDDVYVIQVKIKKRNKRAYH